MDKWLTRFGLLLLGLLLAACAPVSTPTASAVPLNQPSATARASSPTPDLRPTRTPTQVPLPTQTAVPTKAVDYCVSCHTDKDTLIANLKPVDAKPKESEGAG
jgi:hypothetical protein